MHLRALLLPLVLLRFDAAHAGEYNPKLNIGDKAPAWTELPGVDGKRHSLSDLDKARLVAVVFTCNSCDVATDYEDRIIALAKKHQGTLAVVAINVSTKPADALPRMRERAEEKKFPFPYLLDGSQAMGRAYGANYTPEFFLLDADRRVVYMGSMDDSTYADQVKENYLEAAVADALKGEAPAITETAPRGCRIRYPRKGRLGQSPTEAALGQSLP
jgi:peroxiredoxin